MAFINHSKYLHPMKRKQKSNYVNVLDVSCLTMVSCDVAIRFVIIWHSLIIQNTYCGKSNYVNYTVSFTLINHGHSFRDNMAFINHSKYLRPEKTKSNYVNVLDVSCLTMVSCDVAIRFVIIWHSLIIQNTYIL